MDVRDTLETELDSWVREARLPITPVQLSVDTFEDALGQEGWVVLLSLPRPDAGRWEQASVYKTRRLTAEHLDELAARHDATRSASTLVTITGEGSAPAASGDDTEVAAEEQPGEGEGAAGDDSRDYDWRQNDPTCEQL